jgi:hypothetical protein
VDWIPAAAEQAGLRAVSAKTLPVRIKPAARTMSSGVMWLSVPI